MIDSQMDQLVGLEIQTPTSPKVFRDSVRDLVSNEKWGALTVDERKVISLDLYKEYFEVFDSEMANLKDYDLSDDLLKADIALDVLLTRDEGEENAGYLKDIFLTAFVDRYGEKIRKSKWLTGTTVEVYHGNPDRVSEDESVFEHFSVGQIKVINRVFHAGQIWERLCDRRDDVRWHEKMGIVMRITGYLHLVELVRQNWDWTGDEKYREILRELMNYDGLEDHYREHGIIGVDEKLPIPTNLGEVYKNINFEEYPPSFDEEAKGMIELEKQLVENKISKDDRICVLGSGTGWEVNWLSERGYTNVLGVEIDDVNVNKARKTYPNLKFVQGDVTKLFQVLREMGWGENVHAAIMRGRTITHLDPGAVMDAIYQFSIVADRSKSCFFLDKPDETVKGGVYDEYLSILKQGLVRFGLSQEEMQEINFIVDGPASRGNIPFWSKWLYTRFLPSTRWLSDQFLGRNFNFAGESRELIGNGTGVDQNVNLVFKRELKI